MPNLLSDNSSVDTIAPDLRTSNFSILENNIHVNIEADNRQRSVAIEEKTADFSEIVQTDGATELLDLAETYRPLGSYYVSDFEMQGYRLFAVSSEVLYQMYNDGNLPPDAEHLISVNPLDCWIAMSSVDKRDLRAAMVSLRDPARNYLHAEDLYDRAHLHESRHQEQTTENNASDFLKSIGVITGIMADPDFAEIFKAENSFSNLVQETASEIAIIKSLAEAEAIIDEVNCSDNQDTSRFSPESLSYRLISLLGTYKKSRYTIKDNFEEVMLKEIPDERLDVHSLGMVNIILASENLLDPQTGFVTEAFFANSGISAEDTSFRVDYLAEFIARRAIGLAQDLNGGSKIFTKKVFENIRAALNASNGRFAEHIKLLKSKYSQLVMDKNR